MPTLGVAIAIPEPWGSTLQDYRTSIGDHTATLIPTHVTLVPPTAYNDMAAVDAHLRAAAALQPRFNLHLRGTGTFRPVSPVVFVSVVEGISSCEAVAEQVRQGPLSQDLHFPYHPHVTVAHDLPDDVLDRAFEELSGFDCRFEVTEFHLYVHDAEVGWQVTNSYPLGG